MITINRKAFASLYKVSCKTWKDTFNEKFKYNQFDETLDFEESFIEEMEAACDPAKPEQLKTLKELFKDYFKNKTNLFDITTYKGVCKALKESELTEKDFKHLPEYMRTKSLNQARISQLEMLFNGGKKANWKKHSDYDYKHYVYLIDNSDGLVGFVSFGSCSFDGYPGYFKDNKTAQHVLKYFIEFYKGLV